MTLSAPNSSHAVTRRFTSWTKRSPRVCSKDEYYAQANVRLNSQGSHPERHQSGGSTWLKAVRISITSTTSPLAPVAAGSACGPATPGSTCECAWSADTSAAATPRKTNTPPGTFMRPAIRSCVPLNPAKPGHGATSTKSACSSTRWNAASRRRQPHKQFRVPRASHLLYAGAGLVTREAPCL